jgi:hypothetical protein
MLLLIFFFASLLPAQEVSMECVDTGTITATAQTQAAHGPNGTTAVLKVSSADDHSKSGHWCSAEYELVITPAAGGAPAVVDFLTSNGDWGRILSLRLEGFSYDGGRVFGIFSERGKYSYTTLFYYDTAGGPVQLVDLKERFRRIVTPKCRASFAVVGTTADGGIVLELPSAEGCTASGRWLLNSNGKVQRLGQGVSVLPLYESKVDAR